MVWKNRLGRLDKATRLLIDVSGHQENVQGQRAE